MKNVWRGYGRKICFHDVWLAAPAFVFTTGNGWKRSSRDHEPHHPGTTHISEENKLQGTNKGLFRILKSLPSVAPGFGVVRKQVP